MFLRRKSVKFYILVIRSQLLIKPKCSSGQDWSDPIRYFRITTKCQDLLSRKAANMGNKSLQPDSNDPDSSVPRTTNFVRQVTMTSDALSRKPTKPISHRMPSSTMNQKGSTLLGNTSTYWKINQIKILFFKKFYFEK